MKVSARKITPCLWFDGQAEEAAQFYVSIFQNSKIRAISRYAKAGQDIHGKQPGSVMTVAFEIDGQAFVALNGGPQFKFNEAVSLFISVENQEQVDYFWNQLTAGGGEEANCGWLKDKFGLSWQVVPTALGRFLGDPDRNKANRAMQAMLKMRKIIIADLEAAFAG